MIKQKVSVGVRKRGARVGSGRNINFWVWWIEIEDLLIMESAAAFSSKRTARMAQRLFLTMIRRGVDVASAAEYSQRLAREIARDNWEKRREIARRRGAYLEKLEYGVYYPDRGLGKFIADGVELPQKFISEVVKAGGINDLGRLLDRYFLED